MYQFYFKKLKVWQSSRKLVIHVYKIPKDFPEEEKFSFIDQIRRSTYFASNNQAEGASKKTGNEPVRNTLIAFGSLMELLNPMILSNDLNYIDLQTLNQVSSEAESIARQLNARVNTQLKYNI